MQVNRRGKLAQLHSYFEQGEALFHKVRQLIYVGTAIKLLGFSFWWALASAPVGVAMYVIAGYIWVHYGFYKQGTEVSVISKWNPLRIWELNAMARLVNCFKGAEQPVSSSELDPEIMRVLSSNKNDALINN